MIAFGLVLGGAITHLGDRLFRDPGFARGHVVDFIAYGNWFVGNVADIAIVGGVAYAVLLVLLRVDMKRSDGKKSDGGKPASDELTETLD